MDGLTQAAYRAVADPRRGPLPAGMDALHLGQPFAGAVVAEVAISRRGPGRAAILDSDCPASTKAVHLVFICFPKGMPEGSRGYRAEQSGVGRYELMTSPGVQVARLGARAVFILANSSLAAVRLPALTPARIELDRTLAVCGGRWTLGPREWALVYTCSETRLKCAPGGR